VLDPFAGIGSTLKAAALAERQGTGIELNRQYCEWSQERLTEEVPAALLVKYPQTVIESDVRLAIPLLPDDGFDFVLTSPPYWRILSKTPNKKASTNPALGNGAPGTLAYSEDQRDFGCIQNYENFIIEMAALVNSCRRVLKPNRYLALIVSDFRDGPVLYPYSADLLTAIRQARPENGRSLVLQGIKVLVQQNKKLYPYGYPTTYVPNIHHHYVLLYRNLGRQV
jgi:DNA modification methylase